MWSSTAACSAPLVPLKSFYLQTSGLKDNRPTLVLLFISSEGLNGHNGLGVLGSQTGHTASKPTLLQQSLCSSLDGHRTTHPYCQLGAKPALAVMHSVAV